MKNQNGKITFTCWDNEPEYIVQLEPYPLNIEIKKGQTVELIPDSYDESFYWAVHLNNGVVQLFAEGVHSTIQIYVNGKKYGNEFGELY